MRSIAFMNDPNNFRMARHVAEVIDLQIRYVISLLRSHGVEVRSDQYNRYYDFVGIRSPRDAAWIWRSELPFPGQVNYLSVHYPFTADDLPALDATLAVEAGCKLMVHLGQVLKNSPALVDTIAEMIVETGLLQSASLAAKIPDIQEEAVRQHLSQKNRKIGKTPDDGRRMVWQMIKELQKEPPGLDQFRWNGDPNREIKTCYLAQIVTRRLKSKGYAVTVATTEDYLNDFIKHGDLK